MPQLNPAPWFFMMLTSWLMLTLIVQPKVSSFTHTNPPSYKTPTPSKTTPWTWPWT
uniref:ATP synthase complex subunit 8 n=1 Tax=Asio flammeus TaxID=56267 RepID=A0A0U2E0W0_ASIFL|nr:ATP synthase F0 subunit 8 [Asio flammeus]AKQ20674.1 ATP synthase subunit 8 [Asio flammeus]QHI42610.1 ATP synthase F0 subunit 8 [Asio flammeus]